MKTNVRPRLLGLVFAVLLALVMPATHALAEDPATPVQLSDEQVNQIARTVLGAMLNNLKGSMQEPSPAASAPPPGPPASSSGEGGFAAYLQQKQLEFFEQLNTTLRAYPGLLDQVNSIIERVDGGPRGRSTLAFLGFVAAIFATAAAMGYALARLARWLLPGSEPKDSLASVAQTIRRAAASLIGLAVFWTATSYVSAYWFHGLGMQGTVGQWMMMGGQQFALFFTLFLILFRPSEPNYRIVPLENQDARQVMRLFVTILAVVVLNSWITIPIGNHQPGSIIAAGLLINDLLFVTIFFAAALPARGAVRRWLESAGSSTGISRVRRWVAANWLFIAGTSVMLIAAIHAYGAVSGHASVMAGLSSTMHAVVAIILFSSLAEFVGRRSERADQATKRAIPKLPGLLSKMLRMLILLGAAIYFLRLWAVDALQAMSQDQWGKLADYAVAPLAALCGAYLALSYVNYLSARYLATHPTSVTSMTETGDFVSKPDGSSRLRTLIPIIRVTAKVLIIIMVTLLVLSQLGFNITPLLAGASVIGLAISFGSQTLVKDIVSGVLFLAEDCFRIGEYIICGNSSGTVEGFTLRSVRLRHQSGQIFTVPFGQIGEIVNCSRDWAIVTFNMSLDRDVDLEEVRRVTADVAASLKADYPDRLLETLKVQGVKDVTETAIVVLFQFTALPRDPGEIERAARSRLLRAFRDDGISLSRPAWFGSMAAATS